MIYIRPEQLAALSLPTRELFKKRLLEHVCKNFPRGYAKVENGLDPLLDDLIKRAEGHGFIKESALTDFVNLAFVFGRRFDTELHWARTAIARVGTAEERMEALYALGLSRAREGRGIEAIESVSLTPEPEHR